MTDVREMNVLNFDTIEVTDEGPVAKSGTLGFDDSGVLAIIYDDEVTAPWSPEG